ncbi:MAG: adenosylcobinamide-phosphate synthase CbiB [Pararhizobium sp.]
MALRFVVLLLALLLDRWLGDPDWLWRRVPHPVAGFGAMIAFFDRGFNSEKDSPPVRRRNGWLSIVVLVLASFLVGVLIVRLLRPIGWIGDAIEIVLAAVFLAQKSLADHVGRVAVALREEGLAGGRRAVSMIVGRDPQTLDEAGVARAAIESLAENFADGVVAPAFWYAVLGLPGLLAYKMLNTADSMIGHRTPRHLDFGRGAAKLDDLANWPAARLSALLIGLAAAICGGRRSGRRAIDTALRDAGLHRSPNAGWPEAAMAGALDIALAGPRIYSGILVREPLINAAGRRQAGVPDIDRALGVFAATCSALTVVVAILSLLAFGLS